MVNVRAMTLWAWEQQLGIPFTPAGRAPRMTSPNLEDSSNTRRYSQRDLVALMWLRDRIIDGVYPAEAAARLINANSPGPASGRLRQNTHPSTTGPLGRSRINTGSLRESGYPGTNPTGMQSSGRTVPTTRRLDELQGDVETVLAADAQATISPERPDTAGPRATGHLNPAQPTDATSARPATQPPSPTTGNIGQPDRRSVPNPQRHANPQTTPGMVGSVTNGEWRWSGRQATDAAGPAGPAGPIRSAGPVNPGAGAQYPSAYNQPTPPQTYSVPFSGQLRVLPVTPSMPSLPSMPSSPAFDDAAGYPNPRNSPPSPGANDPLWMGPSVNSNSGRELRSQVSPLLRAFVAFDTANANRIVREALSAYPIESVCVSLLGPAFNRLNDLWNKNEVTQPEERFATNYLRGFLFSVFQQTPERANAPLVVVCCSPRETQDIHALMLAVFWRRAGARIVFLGQDVDGPALVKEIERLRPALLAVSAMTPQRVRALARIAKSIEQMPKSRPIFAYCGTVFTRNPENQRKVNGVYLGEDAGSATWHLRRMLGLEAQGAKR